MSEFFFFHGLRNLKFNVKYGYFTSYSSGSSRGYTSTSKAFIFSLRNKEGLAPFKSLVTGQKNAIYRSPSYGPIFGGGFDIVISENANIDKGSYSNFGHSYSLPSGIKDRNTVLAGTNRFTPDEVEVFYLG